MVIFDGAGGSVSWEFVIVEEGERNFRVLVIRVERRVVLVSGIECHWSDTRDGSGVI